MEHGREEELSLIENDRDYGYPINGGNLDNIRGDGGSDRKGKVGDLDDVLLEEAVNKQQEDVTKAHETNFQHPCVGMEFESEEEAYYFYNQYAREIGFSTRRSSTQKSRRTGDLIARSFCCSLQGYQEVKFNGIEEKKKIRSESRTGCKALMNIRKKGAKWIVTRVVEEHNHALATTTKFKNNHYILKRWTRDEKSGLLIDNQGVDIQANYQEPVTIRYCNICRQAAYIPTKAAVNDEVYKLAMDGLRATLKDVEEALKRISIGSMAQASPDLSITKHRGHLKKRNHPWIAN
uniref:FAR1 domain-containing protein n=1 Tax=Nelumbo nucifera TaxID=4432 RepID=A0A822XH49_NELNU|nr:TPA_asm: hypothetical protein HUJ06_019904 [Nelumbo nucifera]